MYDFIIVGQGIAGTMLSWFLLQAEKKFLVIDSDNPNSASRIAAGIINPITGRRFVKTWMADELIAFAETTYPEMESFFGKRFFYPLPFIKLFNSVKEQNDWSIRCQSEEYQAFLNNNQIAQLDPEFVRNDFGGFEITKVYKVETTTLLSTFRNYLKQQELLLEASFDYKDLQQTADGISYQTMTAKKIIFCEGASTAQYNPYFQTLPFLLAKGECLTIQKADFIPDKIVSEEVLIAPTENKEEYYIGATYQWDFEDAQPSSKGKEELVSAIHKMGIEPYTLLTHRAAIRPTVKDRRPLIGLHSKFTNVGIFNGLGTKGVSIAPYFAHHFMEHLLSNKPLLPEVSIHRF